MRGLPFELRFELGEQRVRLVHGSPRKVNEYLFEDKPARTFERIAGLSDCDVLVFGHTHTPWIHSYGGVLFVNCGSVGKPKDGDPRAAFAVLELDRAGRVQASIERVPYDAQAVARLGIDLSRNKPKRLSVEMQLHADWAVTMGCGNLCPYVPTTVDDWDIPDPADRPTTR
jgi:diadenosine tetraphosphatase ApaH/serine/threonine PP2A family protein phosphatase